MKKCNRLSLVSLERRDVPAQFGVPWADHQLTLSFVPDGTSVDGVSSNLTAFFAAAGIPSSTWRAEILGAVQTWSAAADLTVGLVDDDGSIMGVAGRTQHDLRFGDIRVAGRPLSSNVLAVTVPPGPAAGTRGGDIIINTSQPFNIGGGTGQFDLYSCLLQETGHALGLDNSADIDSPMYNWYEGVRSGITESDAGDLTALYGPRPKDGFDQVFDNGGVITATKLAVPITLAANAESTVEAVADISSSDDVDYYRFTVPTNSNGTIAVRLQTAGISLLRGRLAVLSAYQNTLVDREATGPENGNLVDVIANVDPGASYYIRVERATGIHKFPIGQYRVQIDFNPYVPSSGANGNGSTTTWIYNDDHSDDNMPSARILADNWPHLGVYGIGARFADSSDVDAYKISVPGNAGYSLLLTVSIRADVAGMRPMLAVHDASLQPVPYQVVRNADGLYSLQANVNTGEYIYLVASADPLGTLIGDYRLDANVNTSATPLDGFITGTLTQVQPVIAASLVIHRATVLHFVLMVDAADLPNDVGAQVEVTDDNNNIVARFGAASNTSASAGLLLQPGKYSVRVGGKVRTPGAMLPNLPISLRGFNLSDPIGPRPDNPDVPDDYEIAAIPVDWSPWDIDGDIIF